MKIRNDREVLFHFASYPILLVLGKQDQVLKYDDAIEQVDGTKVKLVTFDDGHMSTIENRNELLTHLTDFFKKI